MRFHLDNDTARWFRVMLRPQSLIRCPAEFRQKVDACWNDQEGVLDLRPVLDDKEFLVALTRLLAETGFEQVYQEAFLNLAKKVATIGGVSIIDRLASLYEPPKPVEIKGDYESARRITVAKIVDRRVRGAGRTEA